MQTLVARQILGRSVPTTHAMLLFSKLYSCICLILNIHQPIDQLILDTIL